MDTGRDILLRTILLAAAALISFALVILYLRRRRILSRNALLVAAGLYLGLSVADALPLVSAWALKSPPGALRALTAVLYAAVCAGAFFAARKGFKEVVVAVAAAVILRWVLYGFFVWTY